MSNIYFKDIVLHHFMSYDHTEFNLDRNGYIFISGINNNDIDNAKSNGSGKSSLFSALCWCLTGETPNGNKKIENIYLKGESYVQVSFESNGNSYVIKRSKNPSNLFITINEENKSGKGIRDTEKLLNEYLPDITSSLINSVIILGQGLPKRFTNNSPSGRKEILEKLSNSDFMIEDIKGRIDKRKDTLETYKKELTTTIVENETRSKLLQDAIDKSQQKLEKMDDSLLELRLESYKQEKLKKEQDVEAYESACDELNVSITNYINLLDGISDEYNEEYKKLELRDNIEDLSSRVISLQITLGSKRKEISKLESITDVCPTCGQKIPGIEVIDTSGLKEECVELQSLLDTTKKELQVNKDYNNSLLGELNDKYDSKRKDCKENIDILRSDISNYSSIINSKKVAIEDIVANIIRIETELSNFNKMKDDLNRCIGEDRQELMKCSTVISDSKEELFDVDSRLDIISRMNTLIKRDFRGYLLTNIIDFIASKIKIYSKAVFGTDSFLFGLDGNNIVISYDGKDYESLSGGEKQKADVIIQLAIRDMLCNYLNFSSNILVLDEITDSLDVVGSQNILNLISTQLADVESIYIISHHTDFSIPWDEEVTIVKGNDRISRII